MFPSKTDVLPDDNARTAGILLKKWMVAEIAILAPFVMVGQFWVIFQLITVIPGWIAVNNKVAFSPKLLTLYFLSTVFGVIFLAVDFFTSLSLLLGSPPTEYPDGAPLPSSATDIVQSASTSGLILSCIYLATAGGVLTIASKQAWALIKALYDCPPAATDATAFSLPLNPGAFASQMFAGNSNPEPSGNTFIPFQGGGRRLQEV